MSTNSSQTTAASEAFVSGENGRRRRGIVAWIPWIALVVLAIAVVALGVENYVLNNQLQDESSLITNLAAKASRAQQVLEVLTSPAAETAVLTAGTAAAGPSGRAFYLHDRGGLIFLAGNLKPLPQGQVYDLWILPANDSAPISAGTFQPDHAGAAELVLPSLPAGARAQGFAVTIQNPDSAAGPTRPFVISGSVGSAAASTH